MSSPIYYNNCKRFSELKDRIKESLRKENFKEKRTKVLSHTLNELNLSESKETWIEFITKEVNKLEGWSITEDTNSVRIEAADIKGYD
jgi:hypothetical protein